MIEIVKQKSELHGISLKNIALYWLTMPVLLILIAYAVHVTKVAYYTLTPDSWWFEYESVRTERTQYPVGVNKIFLYSASEYHQDNLFVRWNDELRCQHANGKFYLVANKHSQGVRHRSDNRKSPNPWPLKVQHPNTETTCFVRSRISIELPKGVEKTQVIESNKYRLVEAENHLTGKDNGSS